MEAQRGGVHGEGVEREARRTGRRTRAEQSAANRAAILQAARRVFLEAGYHATTVDAIAREAGLTIGALYSRFDGKADVYFALLEQRIDTRTEQFRGIGAGGAEQAPLEAARRWAAL